MAVAAIPSAHALTMAECSAKYQDAKTKGTLKGMSWNDFRKSQCGADATSNEQASQPAADEAKGLTMAECSAKYQDAKAKGTLNGKSWNDFRKSECSAEAASGQEPDTANTENAKEPAPTTAKAPKGVVFPKKVDAKFAKESPGKARMHTCLEQYKINKSKDALGGLKWIQKGGGYYSICNTKLKG